MKPNDKVTYKGEEYTVIAIMANVIILKGKAGAIAVNADNIAKPKETKPKTTKKTTKK